MNAKLCADLIQNSHNIVVMTGAGISTSAGIPDFRGPNGIYVTKRYDPIETFDINHFYKNPKPFYDFTRDLLSLSQKVSPTFTHKFFKKIEDMGELKVIITQNIDMLHQKAGSKLVYELHGSDQVSKCLKYGKTYSFDDFKQKVFNEDVPKCDDCGSVIKPDIVFFGEPVKFIEKSILSVSKSDLLIIVGTSLKIYPASIIPYYAKNIVVVNKGEVEVPTNKVLLWAKENIDEFFKKVNEFF